MRRIFVQNMKGRAVGLMEVRQDEIERRCVSREMFFLVGKPRHVLTALKQYQKRDWVRRMENQPMSRQLLVKTLHRIADTGDFCILVSWIEKERMKKARLLLPLKL